MAPQKRPSKDRSAPNFGESPVAASEDRPLPHDLQAERAVLGAVLVQADLLDIAADLIEPHHFYRDAHARIFTAMLKLAETGRAVDLLTLRSDLQRRGELDEIGGAAYLASLGDGVPRSSNIGYYSSIVKEQAQLREAIRISRKLQDEAFSSQRSVAELTADSAEKLLDMSSSSLTGKPVKLSTLITPGMESLEKSSADGGGAITGVASGFTQLDEMTAGFQPSDLVLLAARTSQGKTALAMNIARNVACAVNVLTFSLEMSKEQLFLRMLASEARVDSHRMRTGYLADSDWPRIAEAITTLHALNLFIDDTPSIGVREVRARARQILNEEGSLGLIVVDYIQLMKGRGKFDNRQQEIGTISRGLKAVAKELRCPVIALAQLSRAMEAGPGKKARRPQLHDLRESGDLENDADCVIFIYRPEPKDGEANDIAELILAKQRNGPTGTARVGWDASSVTFENRSFV